MAGAGPSRRAGPPRGTARGAAVRLLARRDHASGELREKLVAKGFPAAEVDGALEGLAASGFLDDARWESEFVRRGLESGRGWHWIRVRLTRAGIPSPRGVELREEVRSLGALLARKGIEPATLTDLKERAKIVRFLRGRGYRGQAIAAALGPGLEEETDD